MSEEGTLMTMMVMLGLALVVVTMSSSSSSSSYRQQQKQESSPECPLPTSIVPISYDEFAFDNTTLTNSSMNPSRVFFNQWHFAKPDSGAITFEACAPNGGLVVYLVNDPNNETLQDSQGYAIVLDNLAASGVSETYVSGIPGFPSRHRLSRLNRGWMINTDIEACSKYWIVYENGNVLVGEGDVPGAGNSKLITCLSNDPVAPKGIYWFGFGALRKEETGIEIKNIRTFAAPAAGCSWKALVPQRCSALSPQANSVGDL